LPSERAAESRELYERAIELRSDTLGRAHPLVAEVEFNVATLAYAAGDLESARQTFARVLATSSAALGPGAPRLATIHVALADLANTEGRHHDAIREASRAIELQGHSGEANEPSVKAAAYRALANAYRASSRERDALDANLQALELETGRRPEAELAPARINAGENLCALEMCAAARPHYQRAAEALADARDEGGRKVYAYAMNGLGKVDVALGAPAAALASLEIALAIAQDELPERDHALIGEVYLGMAKAFSALGSDDLALEHAEAARIEYSSGGSALARELASVESYIRDTLRG
jgi:tetratricopeptide (TPR) repeat protein